MDRKETSEAVWGGWDEPGPAFKGPGVNHGYVLYPTIQRRRWSGSGLGLGFCTPELILFEILPFYNIFIIKFPSFRSPSLCRTYYIFSCLLCVTIDGLITQYLHYEVLVRSIKYNNVGSSPLRPLTKKLNLLLHVC